MPVLDPKQFNVIGTVHITPWARQYFFKLKYCLIFISVENEERLM